MQQLAIRLLGPFTVTLDGQPLTTFGYAKVRALLAYLAVERRAVARAELATLLWPDQPEQGARASLSQALTTLRQVLGDRAAAAPLVLSDTHTVQLNPDRAVQVDVHRFVALVAETEAHHHQSWRTCGKCAALLAEASRVYGGAFLDDLVVPDSDVFDDWCTPYRAFIQQRMLSVLERLVARAEWCGAASDAQRYTRQLIALDPWQESSQRAMMRLLAQNGEHAAALAHFRQYAAALEHELGVAPDETTQALAAQIRRGDVEAVSVVRPPFAVPTPPTPLVGRQAELPAICALVWSGRERCTTLTGTGGIGKTRLAIEVARNLRHDFEDGVYFVALDALNDANGVASAIAAALNITERAQQPLATTLREALRNRHLLLLLDNFEHVVAAAPLVSDLLAHCPGVSVIVTSRVPLQIRAEQRHVLEPLPEDEAVALFRQCAQAAGFELEAGAIAEYAAICQRVDRLPLAIEIVAVRAQTLTPHELLDHLAEPLDALTADVRDAADRHQSLRRAIQWSYDLLAPDEQRVFRALGTFAGGCTADAVQAVVGLPGGVLAVLETLYRASMLTRRVIADHTRFVFLPTIRAFAIAARDAAGETTASRDRHAAHYTASATLAYTELLRAEASRWRAWIDADQANYREAFGWLQEQHQYEALHLLAVGLWRYHWMVGSLREGLERLELALTFRTNVPRETQANALRAAGTLAGGLNEYARARHWLQAALDLSWQINDPRALQMVMNNFGSVLLMQGELDEARVHLEVSLALARGAEDPSVAKFPLGLLAGLHLRRGDFELARALSEEGLALNRERHDPEGTADALRTLGMIRHAMGDLAQARTLAEEALELHRKLDHQPGIGLDLVLLGAIAASQGDDAAALEHYQSCLRLWSAREPLLTTATVLDNIAQVWARQQQFERAVSLTSAAAAIRARSQIRLTAQEQARCDATLAACQVALDARSVAVAWNLGQQLSLEAARDLGLAVLTW